MLKNNLTILAKITLIILISSCNPTMFKYRGTARHFEKDLAKAHPDFKQGWEDGCETGMSAGSNQFYKSFYKSNKQDGWKMASSEPYRKAWDLSFWYCMRDDYIDQKSSIWGSFFTGIK